jgi:hypothetical protein
MSNKYFKPTYILSIILLVIGSLQIIGYIFGSQTIRGLGFVSGAAPLPIVFSNVKGVDGFDTKHSLIVSSTTGNVDTIALDKKLFSQFSGAFFLKESYSIFLAYSHIFTPKQLEAGSNFMLCKKNIFTSFNIKDTSNDNYILTKRTNYGKKEIKLLHPQCNNP